MSHWIANLPLRMKFALLGVIALLMAAVPAGMVLKRSLADLAALNQERSGLPPATATLKLVRLMQEHRGLSSAVLSGDSTKQGDRAEREAKGNEAWRGLSDEVNQLSYAALKQELVRLQQEWQGIAADVGAGKLGAIESTKRHTQLITGLLSFLHDVVDDTGLSLDSEGESYHLINAAFKTWPRMTERLGQTRARGTAMIVKREATPEEVQALLSLLDAAQLYGSEAMRDVRKSGTLQMADTKALQDAFQAAQAGWAKGQELVKGVALAQDRSQMDSGAYFQAMTGVIKAQFAFSEQVVARLHQRLDARVADERARAFGTAALVLGLMVAAVLVSLAIVNATTRSVNKAVEAARALAEGDLSQRIDSKQQDEIGDLVRAMGSAIEQLKHIISGIRQTSESVATASSQIAQGNQDLSARTEQQASSLQETASSMEQMSATVSQNAQNAQSANRMAIDAASEAARSGEIFSQVVGKMEAIKQASQRIAEINSVIDGIAFQTNILALNAAVEAARAGEQGRGFAVVAGEVRSLAQRSANAAREIKGLIQNSTESVEEGYVLASETGEAISRLVDQVQKVSAFMGDIATGSEQQHLGIGQVNQAVNLLDQSTQQNAALVEEATAAASSLRAQAQRLQQAVGQFKLA